ncbi:hypothetical protein [Amycolatopsis australiensis]|uniref:hypothetical protein n=1 Tax=Amycolatopsis australiensis TaxID=546364 RepID=UPI00092FE096|nr:hypothetical protein [Amycolatopsis australiensis]
MEQLVVIVASLIALVVIMAVIRKTPPMRLLLTLSLLLLAVLALGVGSPEMFGHHRRRVQSRLRPLSGRHRTADRGDPA